MPNITELAPGKHLVKVARPAGGVARLHIPSVLAEQTKIGRNQYAGVMAVGPCVVIFPVTHLDEEGFAAEMERAVDKLVAFRLEQKSDQKRQTTEVVK